MTVSMIFYGAIDTVIFILIMKLERNIHLV